MALFFSFLTFRLLPLSSLLLTVTLSIVRKHEMLPNSTCFVPYILLVYPYRLHWLIKYVGNKPLSGTGTFHDISGYLFTLKLRKTK